MRELATHPVADLLPDMTAEEFEALKTSIREHGQEMPVLLLHGQILDGWHRYRACLELGIEPVTKEIDTADPLGLVFTLNIHRRHLDRGQIAMIAANATVRGNKGGRPAKNKQPSDYPSFSDGFASAQEAADAAGVSRASVSDAIAVLEFDEECGANLAGQVESGERSLWNAHAYVQKERKRLAQQQRAVEKLSVPTPLPPIRTPDPDREYTNYSEENLAAGEKYADLNYSPVGEAFQEYIDQQDPVKLRQVSWSGDVGRATANIVSTWNSLNGIARDKRARDWEMLPEEQEFIDVLRRIAKEASKQFRAGVMVYLEPAKLVVEGDHE